MDKKSILNSLPDEYRPLSPWAYFGYGILFSIPLIGLICLFVFAFNNRNINRRNYARSYFCVYILAIIIAVVIYLLFIFFRANNAELYNEFVTATQRL